MHTISKNCRLRLSSSPSAILHVNDKFYDIASQCHHCDAYKYFLKNLNNGYYLDIQEIMYFVRDGKIEYINYILLPGDEIKLRGQTFQNVKLHFVSEDMIGDEDWITLENGYRIYVEKYPTDLLLLRKYPKRNLLKKISNYIFSIHDYESDIYEEISCKEICGFVKMEPSNFFHGERFAIVIMSAVF